MLIEYFSTKFAKDYKILFNENDDKLCQMFLATSVISTYQDISKVTDITHPVLAAINTFKDHPSIKNKRAKNFRSVFSVTHTKTKQKSKSTLET